TPGTRRGLRLGLVPLVERVPVVGEPLEEVLNLCRGQAAPAEVRPLDGREQVERDTVPVQLEPGVVGIAGVDVEFAAGGEIPVPGLEDPVHAVERDHDLTASDAVLVLVGADNLEGPHGTGLNRVPCPGGGVPDGYDVPHGVL